MMNTYPKSLRVIDHDDPSSDRQGVLPAALMFGTVVAVVLGLALVVFTSIRADDEADKIAAVLHDEYGVTVTGPQAAKIQSGRATEIVDADGDLVRITFSNHGEWDAVPEFTMTVPFDE